jgi:hypothetical protein
MLQERLSSLFRGSKLASKPQAQKKYEISFQI